MTYFWEVCWLVCILNVFPLYEHFNKFFSASDRRSSACRDPNCLKRKSLRERKQIQETHRKHIPWSGLKNNVKTKFGVFFITTLRVSRVFQTFPAGYIHSFWRGNRIRGPKYSNPSGKPEKIDFIVLKLSTRSGSYIGPLHGLYRAL